MPKFYTVKEVAAIAGMIPQSVYRWMYKGVIVSVRRHRSVLIPEEELQRLMPEVYARYLSQPRQEP